MSFAYVYYIHSNILHKVNNTTVGDSVLLNAEVALRMIVCVPSELITMRPFPDRPGMWCRLSWVGRLHGDATLPLCLRHPALHPDVALLTPVLSPRVLHDPVFGAIPSSAVPDGGDTVVEIRAAFSSEDALRSLRVIRVVT